LKTVSTQAKTPATKELPTPFRVAQNSSPTPSISSPMPIDLPRLNPITENILAPNPLRKLGEKPKFSGFFPRSRC
jgi:hypothetical protein